MLVHVCLIINLFCLLRFIYDFDYGRKSNEIPAHDDAVSCLRYLSDIDVLISGSWDESVK